MKPQSSQHPFALAPFTLEEIITRLDDFESAIAIVDEQGQVVRSNGLWARRAGSALWSAVGEDLIQACEKATENGSDDGFELREELRNILDGRTDSCDWLPATGERIRLVRLVSGSGTYALVAFGERLARAA